MRPLVHDLEPFGRRATSTLLVANPSDVPLPIEVTVSERSFDATGAETLRPADDDFLVFPPATIIPPGGSQVLRIQWLGDPEIGSSQSYYARVAQLPVELGNDAASQLQFVLAFNVAVHVSPGNSDARVEVIHATLERGENGQAFLNADVENAGTRYTYASRMTVEIVSPARQQIFEAADILALELDTLLPPGVTKQLRLPLDAGDWSGPLSVELKLRDAP